MAATGDLSSGAHPTATFPNAHLAHAGGAAMNADKNPESRGANPTAAFPNAHLARGDAPSAAAAGAQTALGASNWSPPVASAHRPLEQLQEAVAQEDWARNYAEGKTKMQAQAAWSAGPERCSMLQCLATMNKASRVLEVGSFCGAAALAVAEAIPKNGEVVALELEPFFVEFGQKFRSRSQAGSKISTIVGPAADSLKELQSKASSGALQPFDLVIIDGDKASMKEYFDLVWSSSGLLSSKAVVCLDTTPFKGQVPTRYVRFGQAERWEAPSGEEEIAGLRAAVAAAPEFVSHEFGGLLVVQRSQQQD